jgi:D-alanine-D-alanine ligase
MKPHPESVLILHQAIPSKATGPSAASDAGVLDEVKSVAEALKELAIPCQVESATGLADVPRILARFPGHTVFNLIENFDGAPSESMQIPTLCQAFRNPCTGNDTVAQTLCLDKWRTKAVLKAAGLPVPDGQLIPPGTTPVVRKLPPPPWIVKPLSTDASEGIHPGSVIRLNPSALAGAVRKVHTVFHQPALVESFFGNREINVAILQQGNRLKVLPVSEIEFRNFTPDRPRIVDYTAKWEEKSFEYKNTVRVVPAAIPPAIAKRLRAAALSAWQVLGCRDYARVDFRLDDQGNFVILEVNPNPDISPESGFAASLTAAGIPFSRFVRTTLNNAKSRSESLPQRRISRPSTTHKSPSIPYAIRRTLPEHRTPILAFMKATGFFHDGEIEVAREVLDEAIKGGSTGHYQSFTLLEQNTPVGWICYGPAPCTHGTFDIYWIGVSPHHQGRGYGRILLQQAERRIRKSGGKLIVIETSGRDTYDSTRGFYLTTGYHESARVRDFYAPGDARVIYTKPLLFS